MIDYIWSGYEMSMIELDIISLAIIIFVCVCMYLYCLKEKPYLLKYVSIGYILLLVFIGL